MAEASTANGRAKRQSGRKPGAATDSTKPVLRGPFSEVHEVSGTPWVIEPQAVRRGLFARIALDGPTGAGKTWSALGIAGELDTEGKGIAVVDTERGSAALYADQFRFAHVKVDPPYRPQDLIAFMRAVGDKYGVIVVDSLSHFWMGEGGTLRQVDAAKASHGNSSFNAWDVGTPLQNEMVDALLAAPCHVICTMRSTMEYLIGETESGGRKRQTIEKVGLAPVQRKGLEYEFTVIGSLDLHHRLSISKTRCHLVADQMYQPEHEHELGKVLATWLASADPSGGPVLTLGPDEYRQHVVAGLQGLTKPRLEQILKVWGWTKADGPVGGWVAAQEWVQLVALGKDVGVTAELDLSSLGADNGSGSASPDTAGGNRSEGTTAEPTPSDQVGAATNAGGEPGAETPEQTSPATPSDEAAEAAADEAAARASVAGTP